MPSRPMPSRPTALLAALAASALALLTAAPSAAQSGGHRAPADPLHRLVADGAVHASAADDGDEDGDESEELLARAEQYDAARTAPAVTVSSAAFAAARRQAAALPGVGGSWREVTDQPYQSDAIDYRDYNSNSSGGYGFVSGRMTALAADGATIWAGGADGGVWKSTDRGRTWTPTFDQQGSLSIGAIAVDPADHSVWVGTGEQNSSADAYSGNGVYRSADGGRTWTHVGTGIASSLIGRLAFDGEGHVYAATSRGLLRHSSTSDAGDWWTVFKPESNPTGSPYRGSWMSDVRVRPGTGGRVVIAALGWRGGTLPADTADNGFYESDRYGVAGSWHRVQPTGSLGAHTDELGRTTFSYSADGSELFAVVESTQDLGLLGVYRSASGDLRGPWRLSADSDSLAALPHSVVGEPGLQAWYNQYVLVDPTDPQRIYLGLEEIYESTDAGRTWRVISPYWNFGQDCWSLYPKANHCPRIAHTDQHAGLVAEGEFYAGNDGGVYRRSTSADSYGPWVSLNPTLHTLQYYYGSVGAWPGSSQPAYWGGLQDNGVSLLNPVRPNMVSPEGGDGADNLIDPGNAKRAVTSYVDLIALVRTQKGGYAPPGKSAYTDISMTCASFGGKRTVQPCEPNPRFIAPIEADRTDVNHWVAGGQYVWDNQDKGWNTVCTASGRCDWKPVRDLGAGAQTTALGVSGGVTYAGWCGNGCNPAGALPFTSGIDTNVGGYWHRLHAPVLPNRIPTSFAVDPTNARHVWVAYGAFSRRWIPGGGVGHVFESTNGGRTWRNVSGDLPDAPANRVLVTGGHLVVGTDVGVFATSASTPGSWSRVGGNLPNASTNDLQVAPGGALVAFTHGRGIWQAKLG